jgi:hypothetical protein
MASFGQNILGPATRPLKTISATKSAKNGHADSRSWCPLSGGLCCKSRFALMIKNSAGYRRGFHVKM